MKNRLITSLLIGLTALACDGRKPVFEKNKAALFAKDKEIREFLKTSYKLNTRYQRRSGPLKSPINLYANRFGHEPNQLNTMFLDQDDVDALTGTERGMTLKTARLAYGLLQQDTVRGQLEFMAFTSDMPYEIEQPYYARMFMSDLHEENPLRSMSTINDAREMRKMIGYLLNTRYIIVVRPLVLKKPFCVSETKFVRGYYRGQVLLLDLKKRKPLGGFFISQQSSLRIESEDTDDEYNSVYIKAVPKPKGARRKPGFKNESSVEYDLGRKIEKAFNRGLKRIAPNTVFHPNADF